MDITLPPFVIAIPARYASTRLPGKPLCDLGGQPLVLRVVERALAAGATEVVVATDDDRIRAALQPAGVTVCMTGEHASGTDRLAECAAWRGWPDATLVVNLQGDEPFAPVAGIRAVVRRLASSTAAMATLHTPIRDATELFDPNVVKLVADQSGHALYFSRAPLPWARTAFAASREVLPPGDLWQRHIGIYAYRAGFLRRFSQWPATPLEELESLEQLRVLEHGERIAVCATPAAFPPGIDTPDDLARAQTWFAQHD